MEVVGGRNPHRIDFRVIAEFLHPAIRPNLWMLRLQRFEPRWLDVGRSDELDLRRLLEHGEQLGSTVPNSYQPHLQRFPDRPCHLAPPWHYWPFNPRFMIRTT